MRRAAHDFRRTAMARRHAARRRRALTLLEVLIAGTLIVMLMAALLIFFQRSIEIRQQAAARMTQTQIARQVLEKVADELRGCLGVDQIGFPLELRIKGDRRSLTFLTTGLPSRQQYTILGEQDEPPPARHDLRLVTYKLSVDEEETDEDGNPIINGILRSEKTTLNQLITDEEDPLVVRNDLWSPELKYLEFRYYDGVEWTTTWDINRGNSLPQLIQITVGYDKATLDDLEDRDLDEFPINDYPMGDGLEHPDRYSLLVRVQSADRFFSSRVQRVGEQLISQLGVEGSGL